MTTYFGHLHFWGPGFSQLSYYGSPPREIGKGKGSHPRQPGVLTLLPGVLHGHPLVWPEWGYRTLHHPWVPWSSCKAEMWVRIHPGGLNFSGCKGREAWLWVSQGTTAQQMLKSVGKIYDTVYWCCRSGIPKLQLTAQWRSLSRTLLDALQGLEDPTSEDVPPRSRIQTPMRVAGTTVLKIPSRVVTASNSCDSQRGAVC